MRRAFGVCLFLSLLLAVTSFSAFAGVNTQYSTEYQETVYSVQSGTILFCPRYNPTGQVVAFTDSSGNLYSYDLVSRENKLLVVGGVHSTSRLSWAPDGKSVLFVTASGGAIRRVDTTTFAVTTLLMASDVGTSYLVDPFVMNGVLTVATEAGIYVAPMAVDGTLTGVARLVLSGANLSSQAVNGQEMLIREGGGSIWLVEGAGAILTGTVPVDFATTDRYLVAGGVGVKFAPSFSQDASLIAISWDPTGFFNGDPATLLWLDPNCQSTGCGSDFGVFVIEKSSVLAGAPVLRELSVGPGLHQAMLDLSSGGTRCTMITLAADGSVATLEVFSLRIMEQVYLNEVKKKGKAGTYLVRDTTVVRDGSGLALSLVAGIQIGNSDAAGENPNLGVVVLTPVSPSEEVAQQLALAGTVTGVPILREVSPSGVTMTPAAAMTVAYTDIAVNGLDESTLGVVYLPEGAVKTASKFRPAMVGAKAELPVIARDPVNNTLTVAISSFPSSGAKGGHSTFAVVGNPPLPPDTDGDGLTDEREVTLGTNPLRADTDGDGLKDGAEVDLYHTNPLLCDTDRDGCSDGKEVLRYHTDPLNPRSNPVQQARDLLRELLRRLFGW
jgi:hypothetical protein